LLKANETRISMNGMMILTDNKIQSKAGRTK
jgi:hypothetical protein